jgi:membrane protein YqaA with SNARE-associated domain
MFEFSPETGFLGLFVAAFISATLLPGGSEVVLVGVLAIYPDAFWKAIAVATVGNTLGGLTSFYIGRRLPERKNLANDSAVVWLKNTARGRCC